MQVTTAKRAFVLLYGGAGHALFGTVALADARALRRLASTRGISQALDHLLADRDHPSLVALAVTDEHVGARLPRKMSPTVSAHSSLILVDINMIAQAFHDCVEAAGYVSPIRNLVGPMGPIEGPGGGFGSSVTGATGSFGPLP